MPTKTERLKSLRAVRQLRRVRDFYSAGVLLWAAAAVWTGWTHPGTRQMWVALLLLGVFAGLLVTAAVWLRSLQAAPGRRPAHHAASGRSRTRPTAALGKARTHHAAS
ncbi:hypothetical protein ACF09E_35085 [Streptomyces sp. NPDC014891]|uniref:hypothetical protein n=1 Tax=Streptomyces sp. NPDC014891 TaxID=3364929 RepID=UPI0036FB80BE